jgi:hypothetical protein
MLKLPGHHRYAYHQSNVLGLKVTTLSRAILDSRYKTPDNVIAATRHLITCHRSPRVVMPRSAPAHA